MTNDGTTVSDQQWVIDDVAAALGVTADELTPETDLLDAGLDSVRIMSLVEKWRAAGHEHVDFPTLAGDPVLASWLDILR
ncbi:phosphopantetheine-binding protein [Nocardia pseudobrasiliensis]|uniref:Aryl carrier-like protein n=1 Tax=Nocardia pseudobrasiliensis TaxID=45979 RepID=A0A370I0Q0_9NOCA|nr:phosphopantetheine-binding protein [Nocardia pseudobrasiliensis]RDI62804.1 aryl carrier-like protein [Nocardia pseudobrasiliensis]